MLDMKDAVTCEGKPILVVELKGAGKARKAGVGWPIGKGVAADICESGMKYCGGTYKKERTVVLQLFVCEIARAI